MTRDKDEPASAESWTVVDGQAPLTSAASAPSFSPGDVLLERYALRRILGRGGMGVVFETYDRVLDQTIALKIVRAEYAGERAWAERLAREVKLARQINHPNVCRVFDIGMAERHPFLTMEFASRGTLRDEIASGGFTARPLEERLSDVRAIASGLAAIHAAGIIHRDVAPQNVLRLADGSLVLSDFGLATDRFEGTSSIQGGTLSYMAPEVVRGARASMTSDIWSLAVVIHEFVFGARPSWSTNGRDLLSPDLGRPLLPAEVLAFQVCRPCLAEAPAARPNCAAEVAQWLTGGVPVWRRRPVGRKLRMAAATLLVAAIALIAVGGLRRRFASSETGGTARVPMLTPTGTPEDWPERSTVLAEVPDRIACMVPLPDGESVRFVWGRPRRAEDVNVRTGKRIPSSLVPEAFAEGCPDTTRDGRVVFAGHSTDDRPFAFVSAHPDARDSVPVVPIAEPSFLSDPAWFSDGDRFLYEVDEIHMAVYSTSTKQLTVFDPIDGPHYTTFHSVAAGYSVLLAPFADLTTDVQVFSSPFGDPDIRFRVPFFVTHVASPDGRLFLMAVSNRTVASPLVVVDAVAKQARFAGIIAGQAVREPVVVGSAAIFLTFAHYPSLLVRDHGEVAVPPQVALAAECGREIVAMRLENSYRSLVRLDERGHQIGQLTVDGDPNNPECSPDGRILYYLANQSEVRRCEAGRCSTIAKDAFNFQLSPDGNRVAVFTRKNPPLGIVIMDSLGGSRTEPLIIRANPCRPSWESNDLLWTSVRHGRSIVWKQFSVASGKPTGRTAPGLSDCTDGGYDPAEPFPVPVRIIDRWHGQVRIIQTIPRING